MKSLMIQEMLELCVALIYEVVLEIEEELMKPLSVWPSFRHVISELLNFFEPDRVLEPTSEETERFGDDFLGRFLGYLHLCPSLKLLGH